jgi:hypothetical protein
VLAVLDGDHEAAAQRLRAAEVEFAAQGVVPDPDDAVEIAWLRRTLEARLGGEAADEES